jgi:hypothetical protein
MLPNILLLNAVFILLFIILVDYIIIEDHPHLFVTENIDEDIFIEDFEDDIKESDVKEDDLPVFNKNEYDMY